MIDSHYETARKLAAIEVGDTTEPDAEKKCADLRARLERTEAELTGLHEEFEPEDFHCVLRAVE